MGTKDSNDSPMRSLSSFKDEIPGGDIPSKNGDDDDDAKKSFLQAMQHTMNSAPLHITMLLLVFAHSLLLTAELCLALSNDDKSCGEDGCSRQSIIQTLAITCLTVLSFFILEITLRLFSTGFSLLKKRLELFDILIVLTTFTLDVVFLAGQLHEEYQPTRALGYLILLRCWRFYSIYYAEVKKIHNDLRADIEMAKYGRRQAEAQADALQSERDVQLKEIFLLRGFLRQHSMEPDFVQSSPYHNYSLGYNRGVSIDRADTKREETRLYPAYSTESAISSVTDYKQREVYPIQEPTNFQSNESLNTSVFFRDSPGNNNEKLEISVDGRSEKSEVLEGSEYESEEEGNSINQSEDRNHKLVENDLSQETNSIKVLNEGTDKMEKVEVVVPKDREIPLRTEVQEDRDVPSVSGESYQERVIPSVKEGIDNPAYEGDYDDDGDEDDEDEISFSEGKEMQQINQDMILGQADSSEGGLMVDENRVRSLSEGQGVTEDVNGVPMTSL